MAVGRGEKVFPPRFYSIYVWRQKMGIGWYEANYLTPYEVILKDYDTMDIERQYGPKPKTNGVN